MVWFGMVWYGMVWYGMVWWENGFSKISCSRGMMVGKHGGIFLLGILAILCNIQVQKYNLPGYHDASHPSSISNAQCISLFIEKTIKNIKFFLWILNFFENTKLLETKLLLLNLTWGSSEVPHKFGPDQFSRVDVYWKQ